MEAWKCWGGLLPATRRGDCGLVETAIAAGTDIDTKNLVRARTARVLLANFVPVVFRHQLTHTRCLDSGLVPTRLILPQDGQTALHVAAIHGRSDVALLLLKAKCDTDCVDRFEKTAMQYVGRTQHVRMWVCAWGVAFGRGVN